MLPIYRIDHMCQAVPEIEAQRPLLEGLFGCRPVRQWEDAAEGYRALEFAIPGAGDLRWQLWEPLGDASPIAAFLDSDRGPGLHHVGIDVTDMARARGALEKLNAPMQETADGQWLVTEFAPADNMPGFPVRLRGLRADLRGEPVAPLASDKPAMGISALLHICQAHPNRDAAAEWYWQAAGIREILRTPEGCWPDMATAMYTVPGSQVIWELIQPVGEDSHVQRYLHKRGAGSHHLTFAVHDWEQAMAACDRHEIPTFGLSEGETDGAAWCDNFIHPKITGGILIQLFWEQAPGVWARSDKIASER